MDEPFWFQYEGRVMTMGLTHQTRSNVMRMWLESVHGQTDYLDSCYEEKVYMQDKVTGIRLALDLSVDRYPGRRECVRGPSYYVADPFPSSTRVGAQKKGALSGFRLAASSQEVDDEPTSSS